MKNEDLLDAIGNIGDDLIAQAEQNVRSNGKQRGVFLRRIAASAAAIALCLCVTVTVFAAGYSDVAYELLYALSPSLAGKLKPVQLACESRGVRMEMISCDVSGDTANVYISVQDIAGVRKFNETIGLESLWIVNHNGRNYLESIRKAGYDENTKTAYFLVQIRDVDGKEIEQDKLTVMAARLVSGRIEKNGQMEETDVSQMQKNLQTRPAQELEIISLMGHNRHLYGEYAYETEYIVPSQKTELIPGVYFTGIGFIDGKLHAQLYLDFSDDRSCNGAVHIRGGNDSGYRDREEYYVHYTDGTEQGQYIEYVYDIAPDEIGSREIGYWAESYDLMIGGDWSITFELSPENE